MRFDVAKPDKVMMANSRIRNPKCRSVQLIVHRSVFDLFPEGGDRFDISISIFEMTML